MHPSCSVCPAVLAFERTLILMSLLLSLSNAFTGFGHKGNTGQLTDPIGIGPTLLTKAQDAQWMACSIQHARRSFVTHSLQVGSMDLARMAIALSHTGGTISCTPAESTRVYQSILQGFRSGVHQCSPQSGHRQSPKRQGLVLVDSSLRRSSDPSWSSRDQMLERCQR
jgi:hypothetical protein